MPFRDGLEAATEIVKHRPIPIIILTAYNENGLLDRAATIPVQGYLIKPVKQDDLISTMRVALATHSDRRQLTQKVDELEEKLTARKLIDRAKGILMKEGLGEEEAYHHIQMAARSRRTTMSKIAQEVVNATRVARKLATLRPRASSAPPGQVPSSASSFDPRMLPRTPSKCAHIVAISARKPLKAPAKAAHAISLACSR